VPVGVGGAKRERGEGREGKRLGEGVVVVEERRGEGRRRVETTRTPAQRYATGGAGSGSGPVHPPLRLLQEKLSTALVDRRINKGLCSDYSNDRDVILLLGM
jgi:hypothetical protein